MHNYNQTYLVWSKRCDKLVSLCDIFGLVSWANMFNEASLFFREKADPFKP